MEMSKVVVVELDNADLEKLKYLAILRKTNVNALVLEAISNILGSDHSNVEPIKVEHGVKRSIKIPDELLERLDEFARYHKMNRSEAVRLAAKLFLKKHGVDNVVVPSAQVVKIKLD